MDFGYDISDYRAIDPQFGTLADFDRLVPEAAKRGIRVLLDMVLNHTSDQHPWFVDAARSRSSPHRDWYIWSDGAPSRRPAPAAQQLGQPVRRLGLGVRCPRPASSTTTSSTGSSRT